ncbi:hypothetical protein J2T16_001768 [Paenibacillus intestini]|nr:hypothetical protein [Paenibacillus intestini]
MMATVGDQIKEPEAGWRRYDDTHPGLKYIGTWTTPSPTNTAYYGGSIRVTSRAVDNNYVTFSFFGTKLRIISDFYSDRHSDNAITIDGVTETYSAFRAAGTSSLQQAIVYEKIGLTLGVHTVSIATGHNRINFTLDAIDIDETGYLTRYALTIPEAGWYRFDDMHPALIWGGSVTSVSNSTTDYNGTLHYWTGTSTVGASLEFTFIGTKLRLIAGTTPTQTKEVRVSIDGNVETYNPYNATDIRQMVVYEKTGLTNTPHTVKLDSVIAGNWGIDAIDIDDKGYLLAQVGQQLTAPEPGWRRYDDGHSAFVYLGENWIYQTGVSGLYNSTHHYSAQGKGDNEIRFKFYGTKLRFISSTGNNFADNISVIIDGNIEYFSSKMGTSTALRQQLTYEKLNLPLGIHEVRLLSGTNGDWRLDVDAVDIDSDGRLFHPDEVTNVSELEIGKRIRCHYQSSTANTVGVFSGLGEQTSELIPPMSSATPNGDFYFIMVEDWNKRKLLVADRNIQLISWDMINSSGMVVGVPVLLSGLKETAISIRLLTGGINASDKNNEWDKYIVDSTLNRTIAAGDVNVWNWKLTSWTSTTTPSSSSFRIVRGNTKSDETSYTVSSSTSSSGFRPLMEIVILPMYRSLIKQDGESYKTLRDVTSYIYSTRTAVSKMTNNNSPSGVASASSIFNSTYDAWKAFNETVIDFSDCWATANGIVSGWLAYRFSFPISIYQYSITSRNSTDSQEARESAPKRWAFEGSNDGVNWTVLNTVTNSTAWNNNETRTFKISENTISDYLNYRINIYENNGWSTWTTIAELKLFQRTKNVDREWSIVSKNLPSGSTFINEGMDGLSVLDRKSKGFNQVMTDAGNLGSGKLFKSSINLKKFFEITNVNAE